ncbi:MAG: fructosamine kinase family protein [Steroidobacteraceae bacterium]|nr:fructosamine kinase family protein [Steroidobacteraceae bacterium]MDW8260525.1 fructosamine kinase family protein [Gammaproteobacteria bacterium]
MHDARLSQSLAPLGDGSHRLRIDGQPVFVKRRRGAPPGFFAMEAYGLELLRSTATLRVPRVVYVADDTIVLQDLGRGRSDTAAWERAGRDLARLHRYTAPLFGLDRDGWCGDSAQRNCRMGDGWEFFASCRLLPQAERARDAGLLEARDVAAVERLCGHLRSLIPPQSASLIHGDLWTGNLHSCSDGELALLDAAAVHYGWAEADLAMLTLFGAPPEALFASYQHEQGVDGSWRSRAPIYNLYHLLNHLNLFGRSYLPSVTKILRRY